MTLLARWIEPDMKAAQPYDDFMSDRYGFMRQLMLTQNDGVPLDDGVMASYYFIWERQLWVRKAVQKLAGDIGRLPLKVYQRRPGDTARRPLPDSPLAQLLAFPNETKRTGTQFKFIATVMSDLLVYGNALIIKQQVRPETLPTALYPVSPRGWSVTDAGDYQYRSLVTGHETTYPAWRIMHIMEPAPAERPFGVSRLEAARLTLAIEYAAQQLGAATFQNGARPGGIINVKNLPAGKERQAAVERFKAEVMTRFGGTQRAGLPAVLEGDTTWLPLSHNLDDAAVVAHRQLSRQEVAALFDIPQPTMGILDEANFASIDALDLKYYRDTLGPPVALVEQAFEAQLLRGVAGMADQYLRFNLDAVMRGSYLQRMQGHQIAINARIETPDEAREMEDREPMAPQQPEAGLLQFPLNYGVSPTPVGMGGP